MKNELLKVSIRQNRLIIPKEWIVNEAGEELNETTSVLLANCSKLGFSFSENLLHQINCISPKYKVEILEVLKEVTGVNKNWTPLVKQWDVPTGEGVLDHVITFFANVFKSKQGTTLACGHTIPDNTFPLERYNGCPFCGTPFEFDTLEYQAGTNKLSVLELWTEDDLKEYLKGLLESKVALDATQVESLRVLIGEFGLIHGIEITIKETLMLVVDAMVSAGKIEEVSKLFKNPNDILRYLWYKHTGFLQIIEPKTIIKRMRNNAVHRQSGMGAETETKLKSIADLKLKFSRSECKMYAFWLNDINIEVAKQCETMHPKRGIWVRVIRALRLTEYSKRKGFEQLSELLEVFYKEKYEVWQGKYEASRLRNDAEATFELLKKRPGLFARSLFSNMLWFGGDQTLAHFREVMHEVPSRLIFTLNMYAETYFDRTGERSVKPLGGVNKRIPGVSTFNVTNLLSV